MPKYYEDKEEDNRACAGIKEDFKACLLQHDCVLKVRTSTNGGPVVAPCVLLKISLLRQWLVLGLNHTGPIRVCSIGTQIKQVQTSCFNYTCCMILPTWTRSPIISYVGSQILAVLHYRFAGGKIPVNFVSIFTRRESYPVNVWRRATVKPCRLPSLSVRGQW